MTEWAGIPSIHPSVTIFGLTCFFLLATATPICSTCLVKFSIKQSLIDMTLLNNWCNCWTLYNCEPIVQNTTPRIHYHDYNTTFNMLHIWVLLFLSFSPLCVLSMFYSNLGKDRSSLHVLIGQCSGKCHDCIQCNCNGSFILLCSYSPLPRSLTNNQSPQGNKARSTIHHLN